MLLTRVLTVSTGEGDQEVPVLINLPEQDPLRGWMCRYEIGWPKDPWFSTAYGIDAIQALVVALNKIAIELYTSEAHIAGRLRWAQAGDGYGFPIAKNGRDLLVGGDKLYDG